MFFEFRVSLKKTGFLKVLKRILNFSCLLRDIRRRKAFPLYWGSNAFALEPNLYEVVE